MTTFTTPAKDMRGMTTDELTALKRTWYAEALAATIPAQCATIARELGEPVNDRYGPKYRFAFTVSSELAGVVYVDDYGHYMTVHVNGREVLSTHSNDGLFVPGPWVDELLGRYDAARSQADAERAVRDEHDRQRLLTLLGG